MKIVKNTFLAVIVLLGIYTKSSAVPLSVFDSTWTLLSSEDKIRKDGWIGPGGGGQPFDAEYLFYKLEAGILSLGLQTGFDVADGHIYWGGHDYYAGDLALSFDGTPSTYEYAVDFGLFTRDYVNGETVGGNTGTPGLDSAGVYSVSLWNNDVNGPYAITKPFAMESGALITSLVSNYGGSGDNPRTEDAYYYYGGPLSYYRIVSFNASSFLVDKLSAHWTMSCGNDDINGKVPEPSTMFLLGSLATGLFGFAGLRKRFTK
ncbi:MAG: PEP-CTERM sorting domain-containing protein [bacterium]